jgi:hypothetical protein
MEQELLTNPEDLRLPPFFLSSYRKNGGELRSSGLVSSSCPYKAEDKSSKRTEKTGGNLDSLDW